MDSINWDCNFPMSNRQAETIVNMMDNLAIEFLDSIRDYERESGSRICFDERDSKELLEIFKKNKL